MRIALVPVVLAIVACPSLASEVESPRRFETVDPLERVQKAIRKMKAGLAYDDVQKLLSEMIGSDFPPLPIRSIGDDTSFTSCYQVARSHALELQYNADRLVSAVLKRRDEVTRRGDE